MVNIAPIQLCCWFLFITRISYDEQYSSAVFRIPISQKFPLDHLGLSVGRLNLLPESGFPPGTLISSHSPQTV